jgi:putative ABC transport system permease protein
VQTGFDTRHVLAVTVPVLHLGKTPSQVADYYREATRRIRELPGVQNVATGGAVPWREGSSFGLEFSVDGHVPAPSEEHPRAELRVISPAFFATLGRPIIEGRDFDDRDRPGSDPVAIISQSAAQRMFPNRDPLNHHVMWTDPLLKVLPPGMMTVAPLRIVGVVADLDDENIVAKPTMTVYRSSDQEPAMVGGRLFVHVRSDPYALVAPITRIMHNLSADQPVEHAETLEDVRAEVLSPDRLKALVFSAFAAVALLIAVVGVAGVLAFSVSARTREFGIRLAVGSQPRHLLARVITEGAGIAIAGLAAGLVCGFALAQLAGAYLGDLKMPGTLPVAGSAFILLVAAVTASAIPAARAARVDVIQALRTE